MNIDREELKRRIREHLAKEKPARRKMPWKSIAIGLVVAVVFGLVLWLKPWESGTGAAQENATFRYQASFAFLGVSDDSENVLTDVGIRFPFPNVENEGVPIPAVNWSLCYLEENGDLTPEIDNQGSVHGFKGDRTTALAVTIYGWELADYGPALSYSLDRFYPREVFMVSTSDFEAPANVTLREVGTNHALGYYGLYENKSIILMFWAHLTKKSPKGVYETVEEFGDAFDNAPNNFYYPLPPVS